MRDYFTLVIRDNGIWGPQFGDYERWVVEEEANDSYSDYRKADRKIIRTSVRKRDVDAAIAKLNQPVTP